MPELNGVEFLKLVVKSHPDTIRMILTGFSEMEVIVDAINECSVYRYMTKPWNYEEMQMAIKQGLETYELRAENRMLVDKLTASNEMLEEKVQERTQELEQKNSHWQNSMKIKIDS